MPVPRRLPISPSPTASLPNSRLPALVFPITCRRCGSRPGHFVGDTGASSMSYTTVHWADRWFPQSSWKILCRLKERERKQSSSLYPTLGLLTPELPQIQLRCAPIPRTPRSFAIKRLEGNSRVSSLRLKCRRTTAPVLEGSSHGWGLANSLISKPDLTSLIQPPTPIHPTLGFQT